MLPLDTENLELMTQEATELELQHKMLLETSEKSLDYFQGILTRLKESSESSEKILQKQIFSQQMMENLINDLLDLAKFENN